MLQHLSNQNALILFDTKAKYYFMSGMLAALIPVFVSAHSLDKVSLGLVACNGDHPWQSLQPHLWTSDCVLRARVTAADDLTNRNHVTTLQSPHQRILKHV